MKLSGSYSLNVKKEVVWKNLNDPNILMKCVPGCDSFDKEDEYTFKATATNQIGPMNSTFSGQIKLSNIKENESYTLTGEGQSSVGFANGSADVKLKEENVPAENCGSSHEHADCNGTLVSQNWAKFTEAEQIELNKVLEANS